jgi:diaminopimelate epimerase
MLIEFHKFHGTGNDFIVIDNRKHNFPDDIAVIKKLCDRRFGIGADGLILLSYETGFDFKMKYFNSDGKEGTMCGNGGRCIVAFAEKLKIIHEDAKFLASDGVHEANILSHNRNIWNIRLGMNSVNEIIENGEDYFIDSGSPHHIVFVNNVNAIDVLSEGRKIRYSDKYSSKGTNVNFVELKENSIFVRTYERGVENETLSCGTGAVASAIASSIRAGLTKQIEIKCLGGELKVHFNKRENFSDIWLEGPAEHVFTGKIELE